MSKERIQLPVPPRDAIIEYIGKNQNLNDREMLNLLLSALLDHCKGGCGHCDGIISVAFGMFLGEIQNEILR